MLNVEFEPQPMPNKGGMIGIDVGIKEFYSDSNGNVVANPKYLEKSMRKLVREPVSYTHLDVYKRQAHNPSMYFLISVYSVYPYVWIMWYDRSPKRN